MNRHIPRCLAHFEKTIRCQLEAGHNGDHCHTTFHANATHTIAWTDHPTQLATRREHP